MKQKEFNFHDEITDLAGFVWIVKKVIPNGFYILKRAIDNKTIVINSNETKLFKIGTKYKTEIKTCQSCGKKIPVHGKMKRFCDRNCKNIAYYERKKQKKKEGGKDET